MRKKPRSNRLDLGRRSSDLLQPPAWNRRRSARKVAQAGWFQRGRIRPLCLSRKDGLVRNCLVGVADQRGVGRVCAAVKARPSVVGLSLNEELQPQVSLGYIPPLAGARAAPPACLPLGRKVVPWPKFLLVRPNQDVRAQGGCRCGFSPDSVLAAYWGHTPKRTPA